MITLITKYLVDHLEDSQNELLIISDDPVPTAISGEWQEGMMCVMLTRRLMRKLLMKTYLWCVVYDNYVFILLPHFYCGKNLTCSIIIEALFLGEES